MDRNLDNPADIASIAVVQGLNDAGQIVGYASYVPGRNDCGSCSFVVSVSDALGSGNGNPVPEVPLPAALPLFAAGLGAMGFLGWRRRKAAVAA